MSNFVAARVKSGISTRVRMRRRTRSALSASRLHRACDWCSRASSDSHDHTADATPPTSKSRAARRPPSGRCRHPVVVSYERAAHRAEMLAPAPTDTITAPRSLTRTMLLCPSSSGDFLVALSLRTSSHRAAGSPRLTRCGSRSWSARRCWLVGRRAAVRTAARRAGKQIAAVENESAVAIENLFPSIPIPTSISTRNAPGMQSASDGGIHHDPEPCPPGGDRSPNCNRTSRAPTSAPTSTRLCSA